MSDSARALLPFPERVLKVAGQPARRDQDHVEAQIEAGKLWVLHQPALGGADEPAALFRRHRPGAVIKRWPCPHLDEDDRPPAPGNKVDLAAGAAPAAGGHAVAAPLIIGGNLILGGMATMVGDRALQPAESFSAIW